VDAKNIKEIALSVIFVAVGFLNWYFLRLFFYNQTSNLKSVLWIAVLLVLFGAMYGVFSFLVRPKKFLFPSFILVSILPIFVFEFNLFLFLGLILFFILISFGFWILKRERDVYTLKLRPMWMLRRGLSYFFLGFSLVLTLVFYISPISEFRMEIPRPWFDVIFDQVQPLLANQLPGFNPEMTVDEFLVAQYILLPKIQTGDYKGSGNNFLSFFRDPAFAEISDIAHKSKQEYLKKLIVQNKKTLDAGKKSLSEAFGIEITGSETMKGVLYQLINKQLLAVTKPYEDYISLGFVAVVFLTLQAMSLPYKWITGFFGWILFRLFVLIRLAQPQKEMVEKETIIL